MTTNNPNDADRPGHLKHDGGSLSDLEAGWLAAIIESADDAIISKTLEGVITSWNAGASRIFGYKAEEIVGQNVLVLIPDDLKSEETHILARIRAGERIEHYETIRLRKDGSPAHISLTVSPIKGVDGKVIGASKIARDISERLRFERELITASDERDRLLKLEQDARRQAELASRAKDDFLGLLSHELRTPLNAILGWARVLTSTDVDQNAALDGLRAIERNAQLQSRLIDDMLDVSRIMSGKLRLDAQPVDLNNVIYAAIETLRPAAAAKDIRIDVVLDFGAGTVLGDPVRLQQVIWNLLSNAVKFTPKKGTISVTLKQSNSRFEIGVADSGPGIDDDILPFIFERFRQGDSSSTKSFGGLGLGLAIVRQIVEMHGGTVEADNLVKGGAILTVKLPIMAAARPRPGGNESLFEPSTGFGPLAKHLDCPDALEGIKVMAVDDDADSRTLLQTILEGCGAQVLTCSSAADALAALEGFGPDVVISDIGMPDEDGYSLIQKIRAAGTGYKRLPAVALTAFARVEDRMKALSAGFNMHVPKPVEPAELLTVIASLVANS